MDDIKFDFDPRKSTSNKAKHGVDFIEAQAIWDNQILELPSSKPGEPRRLVIGQTGPKFWTAIITSRGEKIRITGVRRSHPNEIRLYKQNFASPA